MKKALIAMMQLHKSSGSARTAYENIKYFKSRGYEVHVVSMTIDKAHISSLGATPHKTLPFIKSTGLMRRKWYNWQVQILVKKLQPDITVGHGDIQNQDVLTLHNSVFLASELINKKPLTSEHEMSVTHGSLLKHRSFKKMIANSKLMKDDTVKRFSINPHDITVVYPAVNTDIFSPISASEKATLRKRFKFPDKVIVSLVTSGNFKKRGLDTFIQALDLFPQDIHDQVSFRVIGHSDDFKSPYINYDPTLPDIQNYFRAIDIFVLPARIEEFGRVVLEAMACALPVITTNKVGAAELLEGPSRDFIINPESPEELKNALIHLITDQKLRETLAAQNALSALKQAENTLNERFDKVFTNLDR
jgi:UDP-glucose:(heptosyl)LPS alpha-1,3-glucosyltransferase